MTSLNEIVQEALHSGYITPAMEADISQKSGSHAQLSSIEYDALERLMDGLLQGKVLTRPCKKFINVSEELVLKATVDCIEVLQRSEQEKLDIGNIAAYALNRVPPLYATTKEGAAFQKEKAKESLQALIVQQVQQAIRKSCSTKEYFPERQTILRHDSMVKVSLLEQISSLLQINATELEKQVDQQVMRIVSRRL